MLKLILLALVPVLFAVNIEKQNLFPLTIIHINDFHARRVHYGIKFKFSLNGTNLRFEQTNSESTSCKELLGQVCIGGYARILTVVKQLLKEREDKNPLYLNIGDNFQGTLWYELLGWEVTSHFLNILPADATVSLRMKNSDQMLE